MKAIHFALLCARAAALLLFGPGICSAQDTYVSGWSAVSGGGRLRTGTGEFTMSGVIGQFNAGKGNTGEFSLSGGFWSLPPGSGGNADLAGLIISAGALSPSFDSSITSYSTTVSADTSGFTVSPFAVEAAATLQVRINGGSFAGVPNGGTTALLPLNAGSNPVDVRVTSANGTANKTYTLTVTRTPPGTPGEVEMLNASVGGFTVNATVVDPQERIILAGSISSVQGTARTHLARLLADGTLDAGFNPQINADVTTAVVQTDGRILFGGNFTSVNGQARSRLARVNNDGTLDTAFNPAPDNYVLTAVPDGSGKILIGGGFTAVQGQSRAYLARLNADGSLDSAFSPAVGGVVYCVAVQPDGKILAGGAFTTAGGQTRNYIARLNSNGTLDTAFNPNANNQVITINVLPDGKILLGGSFTTLNGQPRPYFARVLAGGAPDTAFAAAPNNSVFGAAVQADGKMLCSGSFNTVGGQNRGRVARINTDGTLDSSFAPDANGTVFSVALQADGRVLLGGEFFTVNGAIRNRFARINNILPVRQFTVPNAATLLWTRGGSAPDFTQVTFERGSGSSWTLLGQGTRVGATANWQLTGLSLTGTAGTIRARGRTGSGYLSGGGSLIEQQQSYNFLTGFALWAYNSVPAGRDASFTGDWNGDGYSNGLTYVFGTSRISFASPGRIPAPASIPADVDLYLDRTTSLAAGWTPIVSWVNASAPAFAAGVTLVSGTVRDTFSGARAFYRYRAVLR